MRKIASGGFATVWEVRGTGDEASVAMKLPHVSADADDLARFRREVLLQSQLDHENILAIMDYDLDNEQVWYIVPLAVGSLDDLLPTLKIEDALELYRDVLRGISFAHRNHVLHRDLKPSNILLFPIAHSGSFCAKVSDFGLGRRLTRDTRFVTASRWGAGTPWFSAPEQWTNLRDVDNRADVFSLGRILEYILEVIEVPGSSLSRRLEYCIRTATAEDPTDRYRSVDELSADFQIAIDRPRSLRRPVDVALELIQTIIEDGTFSVESVKPFAYFLLEHRVDQRLMLGMMRRIPSPLLAALLRDQSVAMKLVLEAYVTVIAQPMTVDTVIACLRFLEDVHELSIESSIKEISLLNIVKVAAKYDLIEANYIAVRCITSNHDEAVLQSLVRYVQDNRDIGEWCGENLRQASIPPVLREALGS